MILREFKHPDDISLFKSLIAARGMEDTEYDIPAKGIIALQDGEPIAMGFLRDVEGGYALIDGYITHPAAEASLRNEALDLITKELCIWCSYLSKHRLIAISEEKSIIDRAMRHGFVEYHSYRVLCKKYMRK